MVTPLNLIIFDFDGTLINSEAGIMQAIQLTVAELGLPEGSAERWRQMIGLSLETQLQILLPPDRQDQVDQSVEVYRQFYRKVGIQLSDPFPGIPEILAHLHPHVPMAIASSKRRTSILRILQDQHWSDYFDPVITPSEVTHPKPHPESLEKLLAYHSCKPDQVVMIGDTEYDMEMARHAGVQAWGVTWGIHDREHLESAGAHQCFDDPGELLDQLKVCLF